MNYYLLTSKYNIHQKKYHIKRLLIIDLYLSIMVLSRESFIQQAKHKFGDKFNYDLVLFINHITNVIIICPIHGEFKQTPKCHLDSKHGCRFCAKLKNSTIDIRKQKFIQLANDKHGYKCNYDKVVYTTQQENVIITCPQHGDFNQKANNHVNGSGCPDCGRIIANQALSLPREEYLRRFKLKHGDKFDYTLLPEKFGYFDKVQVICPKHGAFNTSIASHLEHDCMDCYNDSRKAIDKVEFIRRAEELYGNFYNYDKVEFDDVKTNVIIMCPKHGEFIQMAYTHLLGHRCRLCSNENRTLPFDSFVERSRITHGEMYIYNEEDYKTSVETTKIKCPEHGIFEQTPISHMAGAGCPYHRGSRGELLILKFLQDTSVTFLREHRFFECKNIRSLPFDFYLPDDNLLIEFDGRQHFEPLEIFGGVERFQQQQINDEIKTNFALEKQIPLLRIRYDIPIQQFANILTDFIFTNAK